MKKITLRYLWSSMMIILPLVSIQAQQTAQKSAAGTQYLLYLPDGYANDTTKSWPLVMFLHGSGEGGNDINRVKANGLPKLIADGNKYPFIVISPLSRSQWAWQTDALYDLLQDLFKKYKVDRDRVYLTGLSMGGFGTWTLAMEHPETFAAIVPICGGADTSRIWALRHMPVWCFHGAKDDIVPLPVGLRTVDALKKYNPTVKLTVYPAAGHDSWSETYANEAVYKWLLSQRRFVFKEVSVSNKLLEEYAGYYLLGRDTLKLIVSGNKLDVYRRTQKIYELKPSSDNEFFINKNRSQSAIFQRDSMQKVTSFCLYSNDKKTIYKKYYPKEKAK